MNRCPIGLGTTRTCNFEVFKSLWPRANIEIPRSNRVDVKPVTCQTLSRIPPNNTYM